VHIWMQRWAGRQAAGRATLNLNWGVYHARLGREVGAGEVAADRDPARPDVVVLPEQLQAPAPLPAGRVSRPPQATSPGWRTPRAHHTSWTHTTCNVYQWALCFLTLAAHRC